MYQFGYKHRCISMDTDTDVSEWIQTQMYQNGYRHICLYGCLLTANKVFAFFLNINFCWCNLLIHIVGMVIVRSV